MKPDLNEVLRERYAEIDRVIRTSDLPEECIAALLARFAWVKEHIWKSKQHREFPDMDKIENVIRNGKEERLPHE